MFEEVWGKRFGAFDISIDTYDKECRNLGVHYEKREVYCFGCKQDGYSHDINIYFWKYSLVLEYSKCICTSKRKGEKKNESEDF